MNDRLAVCSWSLQPSNPAELFEHLRSTGVSRIQLALDPISDAPEVWSEIGELCRSHDVAVVSGMFGTVGEDYTTLETIRQTGGVVPDATWEQSLARIRAAADAAQALELNLVSFHAGFLPEDENDPDYRKIAARIREIAEIFATRNIGVALETGQETAHALRGFLENLGCNNLGVNFDPANMVLYGSGDPIKALTILDPWLEQIHIKDAKATTQPGTWGEEVVVGTGDVNWQEFFTTLKTLGYSGYYCIEREAGTQRVMDIRTARQLVRLLG